MWTRISYNSKLKTLWLQSDTQVQNILLIEIFKLYWMSVYTFKQNCFVVSSISKNITMHNCTFQSYTSRHEPGSVLMAFSSSAILTGIFNTATCRNIPYGNIKFSSGAAIIILIQLIYVHGSRYHLIEMTNAAAV